MCLFSEEETEPLPENSVPNESTGENDNSSNALVTIVRHEQKKEISIHHLSRKNRRLKTKLNILSLIVLICVPSYFGLILWFHLTRPADCTIGINSIQSHLNLLDSELKLDNRIIPRPLWADNELKANTTDLKPLSLPVAGVIAHHTSRPEDQCFTMGELQNHNLFSIKVLRSMQKSIKFDSENSHRGFQILRHSF